MRWSEHGPRCLVDYPGGATVGSTVGAVGREQDEVDDFQGSVGRPGVFLAAPLRAHGCDFPPALAVDGGGSENGQSPQWMDSSSLSSLGYLITRPNGTTDVLLGDPLGWCPARFWLGSES